MLLTGLIFGLSFAGTRVLGYQETVLWFGQPAGNFTDSLLIGNGRLGASYFGSTTSDTIALNEDTIWSGGPYVPTHAGARSALSDVRNLVNQGKYTDAETAINANLLGNPASQTNYQTAGALTIGTNHNVTSNYRRQLDVSTNLVTTSYTYSGVTYTRELFSSMADNVIVMRISGPGNSVYFTARLTTPQSIISQTATSTQMLMSARNSGEASVPSVMNYQIRAQVYIDGGNQTVGSNAITVSGAASATIVVSIASSFNNYRDGSGADAAARNAATFAALPSTNFDTLFSRHKTTWQGLFNRFSIDLGNVASLSSLATDVRIQKAMAVPDLGLISLFVNYGRALLVGSSGPRAVQPANLQGIWQNELTAVWQSKYTININIQMNYWGAELWNLPETVESLTKMMEEVAVSGRETAQNLWGANSSAVSSGGPPWVVHHNTDQWRATWPIDGAQYGMWPTGGLWMLQTLWEHYLHSPSDTNFARRIYPLFSGASQFFLETTVPYVGNSSWIVTNPSISPERGHTGGTVCAGPTIDNALLRDVYQQTITLANLLGVDSTFISRISTAISHIPPFLVGSGGQLQEWLTDWDSNTGTFSHISHLYALFPGKQIDPITDSRLANAATVSLNKVGNVDYGWPIAWRIGTAARLFDATRAMNQINLLLSWRGLWNSMQGRNTIFQIDANLGGAAAIMEMFVQSHNGELRFLPALPSQISSGTITGTRLRGGFILDTLQWSGGKLSSGIVRATMDNARIIARLGKGTKTYQVQLNAGQTMTFRDSDFTGSTTPTIGG